MSRIGEHLKNYVGHVESEESLHEAIKGVEMSLMRQRRNIIPINHPYEPIPKPKIMMNKPQNREMAHTFYGVP